MMLKNTRFNLGLMLWLAAMAGVVVVTLTVVPQMLANAPQRVPLAVAIAASMLQSGILVALAVWSGVALSRSLGLGAPVVEAALSGTGTLAALKSQLAPAVVVGVLTGGLLVLLGRIAPAELLALGKTYEIPLVAKLLYGGITEEVLMRWGLMTVLIWLPWRFFQKKVGLPHSSTVVVGIFLAAALFGAGHLPAAAAMGASLTSEVITYVVAGNTLPAILFGYLYWRRGLEAAVLAHALAHVVSALAGTV